MSKEVNIKLGMSGYYKVQVVNAKTDEVVEDYPWRKNLILNCGMNRVPYEAMCYMNHYGIIGTGSRANYFTSSISTITQSNDIVYLYERTGDFADFTSAKTGYLHGVERGDELQYANGSRSFVLAIIDAYNLQVRPTYSIDLANSQSFTVWKTSQPDLEKEIKRTESFLQGSSSVVGFNCGNWVSGNTILNRRTFNFSEETVPWTYTEVGVSWVNSKSNSSSFARALLDSPVTVGVGFRFRMIHDFLVTYEPSTPHYFTASVLGWPVAPATDLMATESIQDFPSCATYAWTDGGGQGSGYIEPATVGMGWVSENPANLTNFSTSVYHGSSSHEWVADTNTLLGYVNNSFECYKSSSFGITNAISTNIRAGGMGGYSNTIYATFRPWETGRQGVAIRFNDPAGHTKTNEQKLKLKWRWSWDRTLG